MTQVNSRLAPPRAAAMIEALRGLGYTTATALADIIDNSISAGADCVDLLFTWADRHSTIAVLDNGAGMDEHSLDMAMRLGERSPLESRDVTDLGRFGLGLKTASFSQCRRLTVASRREGETRCLRWDLDVLANSDDNGWHLLEGPAEGSEHFLAPVGEILHGTLVLWEELDRLVTPGFREQDFLNLIDRVEQHLAMVFHRFLSGQEKRLRIRINGRDVSSWDPFLIGFGTSSSPVERMATPTGEVEVQCHVLPHHDRLDARVQDSAGGPAGWTAQQGFYVYRNRRLLVPGSWLGLGRGRSWAKDEAHRLARIRLDLSNTADSEWKIDIRKSMARPPVYLREWLTRLAEDARHSARRVFAHRGHVARPRSGATVVQAWRLEHLHGGTRYQIDRDHPAVACVIDDAGALTPQIQAMLRVIEETIPVQRIWLDTSEARETPRTGFSGQPSEGVVAVLEVMYRNLVSRKNMSSAEARDLLLRTQPFNEYPELVDALPDIQMTDL